MFDAGPRFVHSVSHYKMKMRLYRARHCTQIRRRDLRLVYYDRRTTCLPAAGGRLGEGRRGKGQQLGTVSRKLSLDRKHAIKHDAYYCAYGKERYASNCKARCAIVKCRSISMIRMISMNRHN